MQKSFVPLIAAAGAFLLVLLWRVRPLGLWTTKHHASRQALREAQQRIEVARDDVGRAAALCDAADILSRQVGGQLRAKSLYLRATRTDPKSVDVIKRAMVGLARRPRALESLLWRRLATVAWNQAPEATAATLDALRGLYDGPLRNAIRARAIQNALDALK
jgi:hypothetical protein